ncbi:MAG: hypothetical protein JWR35_1105 [Marmoricola sp.]|nr:hypothetical protein [Marmoricola sp.]
MNSPLGDFLLPPGFAPLRLGSLANESSAVVEAVRLVRRTRQDKRARAGLAYAGHSRRKPVDPVLLIPGFLAGDSSLGFLAKFLRQQGFRTYRSGIHTNVGCTQDAADRLERRIETIAIRRGRKVSIVGHSLGGMLARGLASRRPDLIDGIVTMGSPMRAPGAVNSFLAWDVEMLTRLTRAGFGGLMSEDCVAGACARRSWDDQNSLLDPAIGFTAIYSKRDGVADWRACIDPDATAVEVRTSHCGMAIDPIVFDEVLRALRDQQFSRATRSEGPSAVASLRRVVNK